MGTDHIEPPTSQRRRRHLVGVLIGFIAVLAIIAVPLVLLSAANDDGDAAISAAKRATAPMIADIRAKAEGDGGSLSVTWSARPMGEMQMVDVTLRGPGTRYDGRASFMVSSGGVVDPQDEGARMLVMAGDPGMSHK